MTNLEKRHELYEYCDCFESCKDCGLNAPVNMCPLPVGVTFLTKGQDDQFFISDEDIRSAYTTLIEQRMGQGIKVQTKNENEICINISNIDKLDNITIYFEEEK